MQQSENAGTAQIAAWNHAERDSIDNTKNQKFRHLLISQNRDEVFLIFAEYDAQYVDYVTNPDRKTKYKLFLTMNEFGLWRITSSRDVEEIESIILAVTLLFRRGGNLHPKAGVVR
ncbi:uncharacterized protein BJX67DRAFT_384681 [Aspergillus lucknowensis]|uniref:Uncharacterized protein n=1 Tax=Aspergillus lucknowensis TaxID=176173 RepID=A0ABR4LFP5_9EURO